MRHSLRNYAFLAGFALLQGATFAQQIPIADKLKALPGVTGVTQAPARGRGGAGAPAGESYSLLFEQPIDHKNPALGKFTQRVYVTHADFDKPIVLNTEGYQAGGPGGAGELGRALGPVNVVTVEHRHFGASIPKDTNGATLWQYLTVKNAADDMHDVVTALKTIYTGKWVSTGASKGGQT